MRHRKKHKVGRGRDQKRKLLRSLASSLILYEKIKTNYAYARAVKSYAEKVITRSKQDNLHNRRLLLSKLLPIAAKKTFEVLGPKYKERKGGYVRIVKLNNSAKDRSRALVELIE